MFLLLKNPIALVSFGLFACLNVAASEEARNILILNSNMSTEKYSTAQAEFKSRLNGVNWLEIDLQKIDIDETSIEKAIQGKNPDLIYCIGSKAYALALKLDGERKIIFSSVINWQRLPITKNTYGVSSELSTGMQLTTFRYFFPGLKKIGVLYNKAYNAEWLKNAEKDAKDVGAEIIAAHVKNPYKLDAALEELLPQVDAIWLISDPVVLSDQESVLNIFQKSAAMNKPVFAYNESFASHGALMIIEADIPTIGEQASAMALDIMSNQNNAEHVPNPAGSHITLNMKKVGEYGIELNRDAIESVNKIIK